MDGRTFTMTMKRNPELIGFSGEAPDPPYHIVMGRAPDLRMPSDQWEKIGIGLDDEFDAFELRITGPGGSEIELEVEDLLDLDGEDDELFFVPLFFKPN